MVHTVTSPLTGETDMTDEKATTTSGYYDADLQMYRETEHVIDIKTIRFIKWMVQEGKLKGDILPEEN